MDDASLTRRGRIAPKAVDASDVTRLRGILGAVLGGVVGLALGLGISIGRGEVIGPEHPLSASHRAADLSCATCHAGETPAGACASCHQGVETLREGHREVMAAGQMNCVTCHDPHNAAGIALRPVSAIRFARDREFPLAVATPANLEHTATVPLIEVARCSACHDAAAASDPIARCLVRGQESLGDARNTVCFGEHRSDVSAVGVVRSVARELARDEVQARPALPAPERGHGRVFLWLGLTLFGAAGGGFGSRSLSRRLAERARTTDSESGPMLRAPDVIRLPHVNTATCIGCNACVDACPYDVLELQRYVAVVARPSDCCGLTLCEQRCPNGSLTVADGPTASDRPRMGDDLQSLDTAGVYLAGDVTGLPLIRNAINQGAHAMAQIAEGLSANAANPATGEYDHDVVVIGGGPAGISAALEAKRRGLRYAVLEQGGIAESIRSFPRGKLVFDQPLDMPMVGELWLEEATKEELLAKWTRVIREQDLQIQANTRVVGVDRRGSGFAITAAAGAAQRPITTQRVLLAVGRRGTPRKLPVEIPDAAIDHVHYGMADARSFAGQRVIVVGLGDVAMEAAVALAHQPGTHVTVVYRGDGFKRGKSRNIEAVRRLVAVGRIELRLESDIARVHPGRVELTTPQGPTELPFDALFVMIGNIAPWAFLETAGVHRV